MQLDRLLLLAAGITWRRRSLWVLGLLATSGGLLLNLWFRASLRPSFDELPLANFDIEQVLPAGVNPWMLVGGVLALFLLAVVLWLISAVAEGGLIVAVNELDENEQLNLGETIRAGLGLLGRFIGIDTLLFLPLFFLALALVLVGFGGLAGLVLVATRPAAQSSDLLLVAGLSTLVSLPILLLMLLTALGIMVLRSLAFRAAAIEGLNTGHSIKRGWRILRRKLLGVTLLVVILWAIRSVVGMPLRFVSLGLAGIGMAQFLSVASNPADGAGGLGMLLTAGGVIVAALTWLVAGLMNVYNSTSWTLAYKQWIDESA